MARAAAAKKSQGTPAVARAAAATKGQEMPTMAHTTAATKDQETPTVARGAAATKGQETRSVEGATTTGQQAEIVACRAESVQPAKTPTEIPEAAVKPSMGPQPQTLAAKTGQGDSGPKNTVSKNCAVTLYSVLALPFNAQRTALETRLFHADRNCPGAQPAALKEISPKECAERWCIACEQCAAHVVFVYDKTTQRKPFYHLLARCGFSTNIFPRAVHKEAWLKKHKDKECERSSCKLNEREIKNQLAFESGYFFFNAGAEAGKHYFHRVVDCGQYSTSTGKGNDAFVRSLKEAADLFSRREYEKTSGSHICPACTNLSKMPLNEAVRLIAKHAREAHKHARNVAEAKQSGRVLKPNESTANTRRHRELRGFDTRSTKEHEDQIKKLPCFYCNESSKVRGIDRICSKMAYTNTWLVAACVQCQLAKSWFTAHDFFKRLLNIAATFRRDATHVFDYKYDQQQPRRRGMTYIGYIARDTAERLKAALELRDILGKLEVLQRDPTKVTQEELDRIRERVKCHERTLSARSLSREEFYEITAAPCTYCSQPPPFGHWGLDRVNNDIRIHTHTNCVSCCYPCNVMKRDLTQFAFGAFAFRLEPLACQFIGLGQDNVNERIRGLVKQALQSAPAARA